MTDEFMKLAGERIKELRKNKKYTQDEFSELLGIDPKHLSRIECGKTQPSFNLIRKMSSVLGIELFWLFKTEHLENKKELIEKINTILSGADEDKVRVFYKILSSLIN